MVYSDKNPIMKEAGVYKIVNKVNGNFYIGSTKSFIKRKYQHMYKLSKQMHINSSLQEDYDHFLDKSVYDFEIIEILGDATVKELKEREKFYVNAAFGTPHCLNRKKVN